MRDQFPISSRCPLCGSQNVKSVRTREKTYCRCRDCRDVWREPQAAVRGANERRRSTDYWQQSATVA
jgi:hypothetical protein